MSVVVTGATGHLGRLIVEALIARGVPAAHITATGRSTDRIADLAEWGVTVKHADYLDPASLDAAFAGADTLVLVSSGDFEDRAGQHRTAVDAAKRAGVGRIVYTSI
ncbi:MAG: NAD(P)H-binding protein, partial [Candidatus Nanopelagicales bacterium]